MKSIKSPFSIVIDSNEKKPWDFINIPGDAGQGVIKVLMEKRGLGVGWGDYTIKEVYKECIIERKSAADLFATILNRRKQFVRELEQLNTIPYAAVVVEAQIGTILRYTLPIWRKRKTEELDMFYMRKRVVRSIIAWQCRYPGVRWWFLHGRRRAMIWSYRLMDRYWKDTMEGKS